MTLHAGDHFSSTDACEEDHHLNLTSDEAMAEFDDRTVGFDRNFAHGGAHIGDAAEPFNHPRGLLGFAALERCDAEPFE
jgi:hypothetical protein